MAHPVGKLWPTTTGLTDQLGRVKRNLVEITMTIMVNMMVTITAH